MSKKIKTTNVGPNSPQTAFLNLNISVFFKKSQMFNK